MTVDPGGETPALARAAALLALALGACSDPAGTGPDGTGPLPPDGAGPPPPADAAQPPKPDAGLLCEPELRCGDPPICCNTGELCIDDTCTVPGDPCVEIFDCPEDQYCEPGIGRCLPRGASHCEYHPPAGVFQPEQQWAWTGSAIVPASIHVMMQPVVGDLTGDGIPEVAFSTYTAAGSYGGPGVLRVVRGDTGEELLSITTPVVCPESGIALGDLDDDGVPEIVTTGPCNGPVLAFRADGTLAWSSHNADGSPWSSSLGFGAPALADLEGDGPVETIVGAAVIDSTGTVRWSAGGAATNCCGESVTAVYDVNADGQLEIVGGKTAWRANGTVLWDYPTAPDGYVAIGDFFANDVPDVVVVHSGAVSIRGGLDGARVWGPIALPGGGRGGPPTVADFDGDGRPEIGVAGAGAYAVFDPDEASGVRWSKTTQDTSSNITGSSVFDFDGDGRAEVVYNDECYMRIYSGLDGTVVAQVAQNSHTLIEYPVIVDVDADGNAEIVFAANAAVNRCSAIPGYDGLRAGVRVFSDATDNWVSTRKVWNQHAYYVTHVREDLNILSTVAPNWRRFNTFRTNPQSFDAPNLVGDTTSTGGSGCSTTEPLLFLQARIENQGAVSVGAGLPITFYMGTPAVPGRVVGTTRTTEMLPPGSAVIVSVPFVALPEEVGLTLPWFVRADDAGAGTGEQNECREDDNVATGTVTCTIIE